MKLNAILIAFECVAFCAVAQTTPGITVPATNVGDSAMVTGVTATARGIVRRTADGGYKCVTDAGAAVLPGETVIPDGSPDAASIARTCGVCLRLRETPKDWVLLGVLANECKNIQDPAAFGHYLSIYYLGCLSVGKPDLAAGAWHALIAKDTNNRYVALLPYKRLM